MLYLGYWHNGECLVHNGRALQYHAHNRILPEIKRRNAGINQTNGGEKMRKTKYIERELNKLPLTILTW